MTSPSLEGTIHQAGCRYRGSAVQALKARNDRIATDVPAVLHDRCAAAIDRLDGSVIGGEQPGVENAVVVQALRLKDDEIGALAGGQGADRSADRLGAAPQ